MSELSQDESALVLRSKTGDRDAYALLVEKHRRSLFALVYSRVGNYDEARDLVHDAFVEGFLGIGRLRDSSRPGAWFFGIALNLIRKRKRGMSSTVSLEGAEKTLAAPVSSETSGQEVSLRSAIQELPTEIQDVLLLHYTQRLNYEQISALLGIPWGTVQGRLARGRARLREKLARWRNQA